MQMTLIYLLLIEEEALQHKITFVMQQLEIWFCKNDLIVNIKKKKKIWSISCHSHQNRHPCRPCIMFNRNEIAYSSELKFVGLFITDNLASLVQIHSLCASLSKGYYMIKSLRDIMSTHMLGSTYFAYFHSILTFRRRIKPRLPFAGIIRSLTYSTRFQDKG